MEVLFTKSELPGSKLIRAVTGENVSHCALRTGNFVIHSNFKGVNIEYYKKFNQVNDIVYTVDISDNMSKITRFFDTYYDASYDYGAFVYLGLRLLGLPLPKVNLWQASGMFLCTEFVSEYLLGEEYSMITPYQLYKEIASERI